MTTGITTGIIGGGIAGLASAIALAKIGKDVEVFEKASAFEEVGAGLQIGPNAVSALKVLGAYDAIEQQAFAPEHILIRDGLTGKLLNRLHLGDSFEKMFKQPYRVIHRADLLNGLLETAKTFSNINLKTSKSLTSLEINKNSNECTFSDDTTTNHEILVGADGFRSIVRRHIINDGPPVYAGHSLFRSLIPIENVKNIQNILDVNLWLYPRGHVVHYPVSNGTKINIVAAVEQNWEKRGWSLPTDSTQVLEHFKKAHDSLMAIISQPHEWLKWAAAGHPHASTWHRNNAVLIGDAVHPTLPYMAQGAAMAIEDAVCLGSHLNNNREIKDYAQVRQARTQKIVDTSTRLGKIYHMTNPSRIARNLVIQNTSSISQFKRMSWLYSWRAPEL